MAYITLHKSPPPSIGWWPAIPRIRPDHQNPDRYYREQRYWNGKNWSLSYDPVRDTNWSPEKLAVQPANFDTSDILWYHLSDPGDELPPL